LVSFLKNQGFEPKYTEEVISMPKPGTTKIAGIDEDLDELFKDAVEVAVQFDKASASLLQRRLSIGYARAARILDQLQAAGVVGPPDGSKPRDVLIPNAKEVLNPQEEVVN
jgi:S-DNA-T family DNA segregation ATPase FtsK/SpoIIIE